MSHRLVSSADCSCCSCEPDQSNRKQYCRVCNLSSRTISIMPCCFCCMIRNILTGMLSQRSTSIFRAKNFLPFRPSVVPIFGFLLGIFFLASYGSSFLSVGRPYVDVWSVLIYFLCSALSSLRHKKGSMTPEANWKQRMSHLLLSVGPQRLECNRSVFSSQPSLNSRCNKRSNRQLLHLGSRGLSLRG